MNLYLDDIRVPSQSGYQNDKWVVVRTVQEAIDFLRTQPVERVSLDHDLGACDSCMNGRTPDQWLEESNYQTMPHCEHIGTGYDVISWIEEQTITNGYIPPLIFIHTANSSARVKMEMARSSIENWVATHHG